MRSTNKKKSIFSLLLTIFTLISVNTISAQARYIQNPMKEMKVEDLRVPEHKEIPITVSYYNDDTAALQCSQLSRSYFHPGSTKFNPGFYKGVLWLEIDFPDTQSTDGKYYNLYLGSEHIDVADVFIQKDGQWHFYGRAGRSIKKEQMTTPSWELHVPIDESELEKKESHTIRVRMMAYIGAPVRVSLIPRRYFDQQHTRQSTANFSIIGINITLCLILLALGIFLHDYIYILIGAACTFLALTSIQLNGVGPVYLWNQIAILPHAPRFTYFLTHTSLLFFTMIFLSVVLQNPAQKKSYPIFATIFTSFGMSLIFSMTIQSPKVVFLIFNVSVIIITINYLFLWAANFRLAHEEHSLIINFWVPAFSTMIVFHLFKILRVYFPSTIFQIFDYDDYIVYNLIFLLITVPVLCMIIRRQRRRTRKMKNDLDTVKKEKTALTEEKNLFAAVTRQLLGLSNTVLNAIRLPQMQSGDSSVKNAQGIIERAAGQATDYLNALTIFANNRPPHDSSILLLDFFKSCLRILTPLLSRKNIKIELSHTIPDNLVIRANLSLLEMIFSNSLMTLARISGNDTNLLVNLKFEDESIILKSHIKISPDNKEQLALMLDESRYSSPLSPDETNELGFRLVKKAIKVYNGTFKAETTGDGCTFHVTMKPDYINNPEKNTLVVTRFKNEMHQDINDSPPPYAPTKQIFPMNGKIPTILFAESNTTAQRLAAEILKDQSHFFAASTGTEAWNFLQDPKNPKPDVFICNYNIPFLSGREILRKCTESETAKDIPIIFLLPTSDAGRRNDLIRRGAADCLIKPYTTEELFNKLYTIFSISRKIHNAVVSQITQTLRGPEIPPEQEGIMPAQVQLPSAGSVALTTKQTSIFNTAGLSSREQQIAMLISQGKSDKEIAELLGISAGTVTTHNKKLFKKLNVHSRVELMNKVR